MTALELSQGEVERLYIALAKLHQLNDWLKEDSEADNPLHIENYIHGLQSVRLEIKSKLPDSSLDDMIEFAKTAYNEMVNAGIICRPEDDCKESDS